MSGPTPINLRCPPEHGERARALLRGGLKTREQALSMAPSDPAHTDVLRLALAVGLELLELAHQLKVPAGRLLARLEPATVPNNEPAQDTP